MQSAHGGDTAVLGINQLSATEVGMMIVEETSANSEVAHIPEIGGYIAIAPNNTSSSDASIPSDELVSYVLDNGDSGTSSNGTWKISSGPDPYGTDSYYSMDAGAEYSFDTGVTGVSQISLWWTYHSSRCTSVPVKIYDGTTLIDTAYINQRQDGGVWNTIGEYDFTTNGRVVIRSESRSCSTSADAISFTK